MKCPETRALQSQGTQEGGAGHGALSEKAEGRRLSAFPCWGPRYRRDGSALPSPMPLGVPRGHPVTAQRFRCGTGLRSSSAKAAKGRISTALRIGTNQGLPLPKRHRKAPPSEGGAASQSPSYAAFTASAADWLSWFAPYRWRRQPAFLQCRFSTASSSQRSGRQRSSRQSSGSHPP